MLVVAAPLSDAVDVEFVDAMGLLLVVLGLVSAVVLAGVVVVVVGRERERWRKMLGALGVGVAGL